MQIGHDVTEDSVWGKVARKMHIKLMMWSKVRLSFAGRVTVLKTMAYSQIWYLGSFYDMTTQRASQPAGSHPRAAATGRSMPRAAPGMQTATTDARALDGRYTI